MVKIINYMACAVWSWLSLTVPGYFGVKKVSVPAEHRVNIQAAEVLSPKVEAVAHAIKASVAQKSHKPEGFSAQAPALVSLVVRLVKGDITQQRFDKSKKNTIVSAANASMDYNNAGGVAGAIGNIAGRALLTQALAGKGCRPGCAVVSNGFGFAPRGVDSIIHAVGPDCRKPAECKNRIQLLDGVYTSIFKQSVAIGTQVLYIPAISTAIFGCDKYEATSIAIKEAARFIRTASSGKQIFQIVFVVFDQEMYDMYIKCGAEQGLNFK